MQYTSIVKVEIVLSIRMLGLLKRKGCGESCDAAALDYVLSTLSPCQNK